MSWRARAIAARPALLLGAAACLGACADDPRTLTQIVVVVSTDLRMPDELDNVSISVAGALNMPPAQTSPSSAQMPLTLGLVHGTGPLGPLTVTVQGSLSGSAVVERSAEVAFKAGKTLELQLSLQRACEEVSGLCASGQTCSEGECVTRTMNTLPEFPGLPTSDLLAGHSALPPADAGTSLNQPPVCTITAPADGSRFVVGELVRFTGSCVDPEGERVYTRWRNNMNELLSVFDYALEDGLAVGTHTITFCGYDSHDTDVSGCASLTVTIDPT